MGNLCCFPRFGRSGFHNGNWDAHVADNGVDVYIYAALCLFYQRSGISAISSSNYVSR